MHRNQTLTFLICVCASRKEAELRGAREGAGHEISAGRGEGREQQRLTVKWGTRAFDCLLHSLILQITLYIKVKHAHYQIFDK